MLASSVILSLPDNGVRDSEIADGERDESDDHEEEVEARCSVDPRRRNAATEQTLLQENKCIVRS